MKRSRSSLFLMEQLIVITVFAVCAAACVKILTSSYFMAHDTRDIGNAILVSESAAECFKAVLGDYAKTAETLGGSLGNVDGKAAVIVYYNSKWLVCGKDDAAYVLNIVSSDQPDAEDNGLMQTPAELLDKLSSAYFLPSGDLSVERVGENEPALIAFPVAVTVDISTYNVEQTTPQR